MPRSPVDPEPSHPFQRHVPGVAYEVLDDLVGYAIRRAQLAAYAVFERVVAGTKFTTQRFSSLVLIEQNPGLTQTRLGEILGIARSGVMLLVDFHEREGFVAREPSSTDRRAYGLRITPVGRRRLAEVKRLVRDADREATASLSAAERRQLVALLERVGEPAARPAAARARPRPARRLARAGAAKL
jgi:DNA-binding MarR family transcriptional regulator